MNKDIEKLQELEKLAKAAGAAPRESLRKCDDIIEQRVQARIADGETELQARSFVLSDRDPVGSRLYALRCEIADQAAYSDTVFMG